MEKFCSKLLSIMKLQISHYMFIIVLCIIAIVFCVFLRKDKKYKILLWISGICLIGIIILFVNTIVPIYIDYSNKSFIQLENVTIVSKPLNGFDSSGTKEIEVHTTEGNVIRLKTTNLLLENGEYKARAVYSERSGYLVDWEIIE